MKFQFALLALLLFPSPQTSTQTVAETVVLQKKILPSTGQLAGISNLFFEKLKNNQVQYPPDWKEVEISPLMQNRAFVTVYALRYKETTGDVSYVVDSNGDLDFRSEPLLQFRKVNDLRIADLDLTIRAVGANPATHWKMSYQIILSNDGYIYARISEYRQGEIRIGDKTFNITLRPRARNNPLFSLSGATIFFVDLNRDGESSERWRISETGEISPREEIELTSPFIVGGQRLKIIELDPTGAVLKIRPSSEEVSISPGFKAPEFTFKGIDNRLYGSANLRGKIVLLEFWSLSCPVCKRILPEVNALIKKDAGEDFVALAVAKEEDAEEIKKHLQENPRNATVVVNDNAAWQTYDSPAITPTYYLIDPRGVIRLSGYGGSSEQLKVIERLIEQIRRGM